MIDEGAPLLVRDGGLTNLAVEVNMLQDTLKGEVRMLQFRKRLVQPVAHTMVDFVPDVGPTSLLRDEEGIPVEVRKLSPRFRLRLAASRCYLLTNDSFSLGFELVRRSLQEEHPKDVFLELRGIHLPAQDVCRREEMPFELRKRQAWHAELLKASCLPGHIPFAANATLTPFPLSY